MPNNPYRLSIQGFAQLRAICNNFWYNTGESNIIVNNSLQPIQDTEFLQGDLDGSQTM
ncbi:hypothetical protein [Chloroflexus sp. Y-396-1]|uniref:hypothetical protein n=1 Tax=Chloroflexus sp. Y-396-1 TaxID=867845 RepID=UPI0004B38A0E|nr:hypothetical protein [Chloroflexus sp. Y-396-1]